MSVARRNLKKADAPNSDSMNRNRIQGQRRRVTRQWTGTPDSHSVGDAGKSGEDRVKDAQLTLGDLPVRPADPDYRGGNVVGWTWEKSAEAVVVRLFREMPTAWATSPKEANRLARADEGLNLFLQATVWNDSMDVKRQQGSSYQPLLFEEQTEELRPGSTGDGGTEAGGCEVSQASAALDQARALPDTTGTNKNRNRRIRKVRPVVWEDGGSNSPSYPIIGERVGGAW